MKKLCLTLLAIFVFAVSANAAVVIPIDKTPGAPPMIEPGIPNMPPVNEKAVKQKLREVDLLLKYLAQNPNTSPDRIEALVTKKVRLESMLPPRPKKEPRAEKPVIPDLSAMQALISDRDAAVMKDMEKPSGYGPSSLGAFARPDLAPCPLENGKHVKKHPPVFIPTYAGPAVLPPDCVAPPNPCPCR